MDDDLTSRLRDAAGTLPALDEATLERMVHRPGRTLHVAVSVFACVVVAALIVVVTNRTESVDLVAQPDSASNSDQQPGRPHSEPSADQPPGVSSSVPESAELPRVQGEIVASTDIAPDLRASGTWQVLGVARPAIAGPSQLSLTQAELDEAWAGFEVDGDPPTLPPGHVALLASVAGTCADTSAVQGVEQIRAIQPAGTFFAMHVDPVCAIIDRFGTGEPGPRTLMAVSIPSDAASTAVGVEAVTASVADLEWDLLAIQTDPTGEFFGSGREDPEGLEWIWSTWNVTGEVPQLTDDRRAWVTEVPGTCTDPSNLHRVEAMGYVYDDGHGTVMLIMQFDPTCAILAPNYVGIPQSVYAVTLGTAVSDTLHGPRGFLVCPSGRAEAPCDASTEQTQTLEGDRLVAISPWE